MSAAPALADCLPVASVTLTPAKNGTMLAPLDIDGTRVALVVDTGSPVSVLRESAVEALRLPRFPIPLDRVSGVAGRPFEQRAEAARVSLGPLHAEHVSFLVEPRSHAPDPESSGLIGADRFQGFDVALDFPARRLALTRHGTCPATGLPGFRSLVETSIRVEPSGHILLPVRLDGRRVEALLDTGATRSVLTFEAAHRLFGLDSRSPGVVEIGRILGADGGSTAAYARRFRRLMIGDIAIDRPVLELMQDETRRLHRVLEPGATPRPPPEGMPDLILGMDQLAQFGLVIDYADRILYVSAGSGGR